MAMTIPEADMIFDGWADAPPAHLLLGRIDAMIAAWLGVRRRPSSAAETGPEASGRVTAEALALMPGMVMGPPVKLPETNVFDFAALKAQHAERRAVRG